MRTLGILGGMAWPSTLEAYRALNEQVNARLGGHHSAPLLIWSGDFAQVEAHQSAGDWNAAGALLADAAARLEAAGAQGLMLMSNTMHRVADAIEARTSIPLLHLADATAQRITADGVRRVGLLGTRYTMEHDFYRGRLEDHGLEVLVPPQDGREAIHRLIYDELVHGHVRDASRQQALELIGALEADGAQGIVAGCTEIELLVGPQHINGAYYPTTALHVEAAVDWILAEDAHDRPR